MARVILYSPQGQDPIEVSEHRVEYLKSIGWTEEGISKENATVINKLIKSFKLKVQSQIQGEQIRVTAKKIDDLQHIIGKLKEENLSIPLQYINFKK